ncbi:CURVATURE THYLAKOID 1B protein [Nymphaea thermarum]|nr:CURVATURE THYLAKOID 1B protein [Nymphaea thermarum]
MASSTAAIAVPSSTTFPEAKSGRAQVAASPQCVGLPPLTPAPTAAHSRPQNREGWKSMASCRRIARSVMAMATGDAVAEVGADISSVGANISGVGTEISDITKGIVEAAVEQLPLVPGALEVVGIGYTGWFAYRNLIYKPDSSSLVHLHAKKMEK